MKKGLSICYKGGSGRIVEKKSEFIADIIPIKNEEEAEAFIAGIRKQYWDARHHCYAYICGDAKKLSDDGEPSQTAGKPMMDILDSMGLTNVCAVVTRYFGGTLLGTGGLVRAYQGALKAGLDNCVILEKHTGCKMSFIVDYDVYGAIQHLAESGKIYIIDSGFEDRVFLSIVTADEDAESLINKINELTSGKSSPVNTDKIEFVIDKGKVIIL